MRLAVSNIAWPAGQNEVAARILRDEQVEGVEIAPTKVWPRPLETTPAEWSTHREFWESRGLLISSLQALLFGRSDLLFFGDSPNRSNTLEYLKKMIELAAALGAGPLVFGSPKNRLIGALSRTEADSIAVPFFRKLGEHAERFGTIFCIEPNPVQYGCDYIRNAVEGLDLVSRVDHPGFGLHLDTAGMVLAEDDLASTFEQAACSGHWNHFHISEPHLAPINGQGTNHQRFAKALASEASQYQGWAAIEMREPLENWQFHLCESIRYAKKFYFSSQANTCQTLT